MRKKLFSLLFICFILLGLASTSSSMAPMPEPPQPEEDTVSVEDREMCMEVLAGALQQVPWDSIISLIDTQFTFDLSSAMIFIDSAGLPEGITIAVGPSLSFHNPGFKVKMICENAMLSPVMPPVNGELNIFIPRPLLSALLRQELDLILSTPDEGLVIIPGAMSFSLNDVELTIKLQDIDLQNGNIGIVPLTEPSGEISLDGGNSWMPFNQSFLGMLLDLMPI